MLSEKDLLRLSRIRRGDRVTDFDLTDQLWVDPADPKYMMRSIPNNDFQWLIGMIESLNTECSVRKTAMDANNTADQYLVVPGGVTLYEKRVDAIKHATHAIETSGRTNIIAVAKLTDIVERATPPVTIRAPRPNENIHGKPPKPIYGSR